MTRTALWVRERACLPLVLVEAVLPEAAARRSTAQVTEMTSVRSQQGRRTRRRRAA